MSKNEISDDEAAEIRRRIHVYKLVVVVVVVVVVVDNVRNKEIKENN